MFHILLLATLWSIHADRIAMGSTSDCCTAHELPGCDNVACSNEVCAIDPFCCEESWDGACADLAQGECTACGATSTCCEIHETTGCDNAACEALVCEQLPQCCTVGWGIEGPIISGDCVNQAILLCDGLCDSITADCGAPTSGSCCEPNDTTHCSDAECCELVCLGDPDGPVQNPDSYCCLVEWDTLCEMEAGICGDLCQGDAGSCCEPNFDFPGCNNAACMECVCPQDSFCCNFGWSPFCVDIAFDNCADVCGCEFDVPPCPENSPNDCCFAGFENPGCADEPCCDAVCAQDPFCCTNFWDFSCQDAAAELCAICGGSPCTANVISLHPQSGTVDARRPYAPDEGVVEGIGSPDEPLTVVMSSAGAPSSCFGLCESSTDGQPPNDIAAIEDAGDGTYTITLARPITVNATTTLSFGDVTIAHWISHPGNVDANNQAGPLDILAMIDILNGVAEAQFGAYSSDVDRSGQTGPTDILGVIDLLNGAGQLPQQNGTPLPGFGACTN